MIQITKASLAVLTFIALTACSKPESAATDSTAAIVTPAATTSMADDEAAIRGINETWFKDFNAHDADAITALYADDAVLYPPGAAAARGSAAIKASYQAAFGEMQKAGLKNNSGSNSESGVSGDLAWESNTFNVTDASGKTVEAGKYMNVFERRNGKWLIVRDIWNMNSAPGA
ncbi:MAG: nuclear transport factor 2 family protein [Gemmatimonadaceae bacterium]